MIGQLRHHRATLLTRHFYRALFDLGVFAPQGPDAFVRVIIGLFSLLVSLGLLLVYMYSRKYAALFAAATEEPYARALLADTTLAIGLPMWLVALVTVLVSHSLFPDETDFRVLTPLPIERQLVFASKLVALTLFAGLFALTSHLAVTPLVLLISTGPWAVDGPVRTVLAYWVVSVAASAFALLAVVAVNGLLIICTPRAYIYRASASMRSIMLAALVLALPLVMALPTQSVRLAQGSTLMLLAPPAWFMGVQRALLGHRDAYVLRLAQLAALAIASAAVLSAASYLVIYRRFDRVMLGPAAAAGTRMPRWRARENAARAAIRDFTSATLRRSALHQGVVLALSACGVALSAGMLLANDGLMWLVGEKTLGRDLLRAIAGMPFPLIALLGIAARASLALPIEPQANWVFRLAEHDANRADQLHAAERVVTLCSAAIPVALTLPIHWLAAGRRAIVASALTALVGLLWAEALLRDWHRIPFTCSYIPGKHSVAEASLVGVSLFLVVSTIGSALELAILRGPTGRAIVAVIAVLAVLAAVLRRRRRRLWKETPLAFEDELPSDVQVFRFSGW